jgi:hypothetical protein
MAAAPPAVGSLAPWTKKPAAAGLCQLAGASGRGATRALGRTSCGCVDTVCARSPRGPGPCFFGGALRCLADSLRHDFFPKRFLWRFFAKTNAIQNMQGDLQKIYVRACLNGVLLAADAHRLPKKTSAPLGVVWHCTKQLQSLISCPLPKKGNKKPPRTRGLEYRR